MKNALTIYFKNPFIGDEKKGDLQGVRVCGFNYGKTAYRIAYTLKFSENENSEKVEVIIVVLAGTHENFYKEIKSYLK